MEKYYILLTVPGHNPYFMPVDGEKVLLKGFEEFEFFLHHPYKGVFIMEEWTISEATTGLMLTEQRGKTQEEAIDLASTRMNEAGLDKLRQSIAENAAKQRSPWQPQLL
jgi:hypothetical protein